MVWVPLSSKHHEELAVAQLTLAVGTPWKTLTQGEVLVWMWALLLRGGILKEVVQMALEVPLRDISFLQVQAQRASGDDRGEGTQTGATDLVQLI